MEFLSAVVALFVISIGMITFYDSTFRSDGELKRDGAKLSTIMMVVGVFGFAFAFGDTASTFAAAAFVCAILFITYMIISYCFSGEYSFECGKMHKNVPDKVACGRIVRKKNNTKAAMNLSSRNS